MKKINYMVSLVLALVMAVNVHAQEALLSAQDVVIKAGEKVNVDFELQNPDNISSIQLFVELPAGISLAGKPIFNEERRGEDVDEFGDPVQAGTAIAYNNDNGTVRMIICDTQTNIPFKGNSGKICSMPVKASDELLPGEYPVKVTGVVLAYVNGTTIELDDFTFKAIVPVPTVDVTAVVLNMTEVTMLVGSTITLTAAVEPEDATDKALTWASSDETVATVADGVVTAVAAGTAVITVSSVNGKTATCQVTVTNPVVEVVSVALDKTTLTLNVGDTEMLTATVNPEDATDKALTWASSDETVATVADGVVTAVAAGTAVITVSSVNGKTATCQVTVTNPVVEVVSVVLDKTALTLNVGDTETLTATVNPEDATDKALTWASSDVAVATVADGVVTAVAAGTAVITVSSVNGKTATCQVTVDTDVAVESIAVERGRTNGAIYTVAGQYVGQSVTALNKGVYIINGKKVVIR